MAAVAHPPWSCHGRRSCGVWCSCGWRGVLRCPGPRTSATLLLIVLRWTDVSPCSAGYAKVTPETRVTRVSPRGNLPPPLLIRTVYIWSRLGRAGPLPLTKTRPQVTRSALRLAGPAPTTSDGRRRRRASRGNRSRDPALPTPRQATAPTPRQATAPTARVLAVQSQMTGSSAHGLAAPQPTPYPRQQVMSVSAKPRLADQQPSSAVGCSG